MLYLISLAISLYFISVNEGKRLYLLSLTLLCWPNWMAITLNVGFEFNLTLYRILLLLYLIIYFKKIPVYFFKSKLLYYSIFTIVIILLDFSIWDLKRFFSERYLLTFLIAPVIAARLFINSNYLSFIRGLSHGAIILLIFSILEIIFASPIETFDIVSNFIGIAENNVNILKEEVQTRAGFLRPTAGYWNNIILGLAFVVFSPFFLKEKVYGNYSIYFLIFMAGITFSRTAIIGLLIIIVLNLRKISFFAKLLSFIGVFLFSLIFIADSIDINYDDQSIFSIQSRLNYIIILLENYDFTNLILGLGIGEYYRLIFSGLGQFLPADNSIAMMIFSEGIVGSFLLLMVFLKALILTYNEKNYYMFSFVLVNLLLILISNSVVQDGKLFILTMILILHLIFKYGINHNLYSRV